MKPDFLDTPEAWTRTGRQSLDPVRYSASIEGDNVRRYDRFADVAMVVIAVVVVALWAWGLIP